MAELLLELLSEEIPARMQAQAAADLKRLVGDGIEAAKLRYRSAEAHVTPRRLTLVVDGLPEKQPDVVEERRGPRSDAPERAIQGFLRSVGVSRDQVEERRLAKGTFLFAVIKRKGRPTAEVLVEVLDRALATLPWPKSMRWADHSVRWVRPLHSIVCLLGGQVVPIRFGPVTAGATTTGHPFLHPKRIAVADFADYRAKLAGAAVIIDAEERRARILSGAERLATAEGLSLRRDKGLLAEVSGLVEWPVPLIGQIDAAFMGVPPEVLITAMRTHQKYFSLLDGEGRLAPRFIVVANIEGKDGGRAIVAGNERVLRARLADAKFFWDNDRKQTLESRLEKLAERVFHAKLGSDRERADRLARLAAELATEIGADPHLAARAALLCKTDLTTDMVGEFPELQGVMGRYYAEADGEPAEVVKAIGEHYAPQGPDDRCPSAPLSVAVALADKIDTLVGFFGIGERPTGSGDPFALRRAALGAIRLIVESGLRLRLLKVFDSAARPYREAVMIKAAGEASGEEEQSITVPGFASVARPGWDEPHERTSWELLDFFADRLKVYLRDRGVRHDLISAVFAVGGEDDLVRLLARVNALKDFLATDDGANLLIAYKRASNIVRIEEKRDQTSYEGTAEEWLLSESEEKELYRALIAAQEQIRELLKGERFSEAMQVVARLRPPVDAFFDSVTVNCEDARLRANRLRLLSQIRLALRGIADFSQIEGQTEG